MLVQPAPTGIAERARDFNLQRCKVTDRKSFLYSTDFCASRSGSTLESLTAFGYRVVYLQKAEKQAMRTCCVKALLLQRLTSYYNPMALLGDGLHSGASNILS